ncbi:MAG: hypothetical protein IJY47_00255 [Clostridia bacterium]|nr:hypothetical protein [Clostridia bacterium]
MNGYNRHAQYRKGVYRRRQLQTVLITAGVLLLLLFIAFLIVGNLLSRRSEAEETDSTVSDTETDSAQSRPTAARQLRGSPLLIETADSTTLASRLRALAGQGIDAASVPMNTSSGALLYRSPVAVRLGLTANGTYTTTPEQAMKQAKDQGIYVSGTFYLNALETEDKLLRSVELAQVAAVIAEAMEGGMDDVLLIPPVLTEEQIPELLRLAESIRDLVPNGILGCALPLSLLEYENSSALVNQLAGSFNFLALDLSDSGDMDPSEHVETVMSSSGILFYLLRYEMRILLPELTDTNAQSSLISMVEANWTSNWQVLSRAVETS